MLLVIGSYQALIGIPALLNDTIYVTDAGHLYAFDLTAWGWVHLLLGAVVALVGLAIMRGAAWARWAGIAVVVLSLSVNFLFLPYYPLWSVVTIALDLAVLAALVMDRSDGH
nr:hypothetical protein [Pseudonocardia broussonetiae]